MSKRNKGIEWRAASWAARHPGVTLAGPALSAAVVEFGPMGVGATAAGVAAAGLGWYRGHPDSFDRYAGPGVRALRRRWLRYVGRRWRDIMDACGFSRQHRTTGTLMVPRVIRVRSASPSIDTIYVRMLRGQSVKHFQDRQAELGDALKASSLSIIKVKPQVLAITVVRGNPFEADIPATEIPGEADEVDLTALELGEDEFGNPWQEPLLGHNWLTSGAMGSGKSSPMWNSLRAMGPAIRDGLVRPDMMDFKGGMETEAGRPLFTRHTTDVAEAVEHLEALRDEMKARQTELRQQGKRKLSTPSREFPLRPLYIDEMAMLTALGGRDVTRDSNRLLAEIMTQGRALGFPVCAFLQEPTKDVLPVRDLFTRRISLRALTASHVDMVLGEDARTRGALADEIPDGPDYAGVGFRVDQRSRRPLRVRAGHTTDEDIAELVRECTPPDEFVPSNVVELYPDDPEESDEDIA